MTPSYKPRIGISLDHRHGKGFSRFPWYALRENYFHSVSDAGGIPMGIPYILENINDYLETIDGLVIPGGNLDIHPSAYGDNSPPSTSDRSSDHRTRFELNLIEKALERDMPLLGLCGGMQMINVYFGGTLIQDISTEKPDALPHKRMRTDASFDADHRPDVDLLTHPIRIQHGTRLHTIIGTEDIVVNTSHKRAIKTLGKGLDTGAIASDGIVEAIETLDFFFCIGVQWHPEFISNPGDRLLFNAFIEACRTYAQQKHSPIIP